MNGNSVVVRHPSTEMIRDAFMSISLMRKGRLNSRSFVYIVIIVRFFFVRNSYYRGLFYTK